MGKKIQVATQLLLSVLYVFLFVRSGSVLLSQFSIWQLQQVLFYGSFLWVTFQMVSSAGIDLSFQSVLTTFFHFAFPAFLEFSNYGGGGHYVTVAGQIIFSFGLAIATLAVLDLGGSFSLFPSTKQLVRRGLYRYVRHPMYLGYVFLILGSTMTFISVRNVVLFFLFLGITHIRACMEESRMMHSHGYASYKGEVPYRLIPWIY